MSTLLAERAKSGRAAQDKALQIYTYELNGAVAAQLVFEATRSHLTWPTADYEATPNVSYMPFDVIYIQLINSMYMLIDMNSLYYCV